MIKWNPLLVLFLSFILYWIVLYIVAISVDSQHAGGEQYFSTIIAKGIDLSPVIEMILFGILCLIFKEWTIRNKWLSIMILILLLVASIFLLFFNH
jgi:hypothetical protein